MLQDSQRRTWLSPLTCLVIRCRLVLWRRLGSTRWHHSHFIRFAAFLPDGKSALSVSLDEIIHIWDCTSGKELRTFGPGTQDAVRYLTRCYDAALAPDGKTVAVSFDDYHDRGARLWDTATGKELPPLDAKNNRSVRLVAFAPDGKHLATSDYTTIRIWDWRAGKEVNSFRQALQSSFDLGALAFSPDGKTLLSGWSYEQGPPFPNHSIVGRIDGTGQAHVRSEVNISSYDSGIFAQWDVPCVQQFRESSGNCRGGNGQGDPQNRRQS